MATDDLPSPPQQGAHFGSSGGVAPYTAARRRVEPERPLHARSRRELLAAERGSRYLNELHDRCVALALQGAVHRPECSQGGDVNQSRLAGC